MDMMELIRARHSVRQYREKSLDEISVQRLTEVIEQYNREGGLHIQLVRDEPKAFTGPMAKYGSFRGVSNYFAIAGKDAPDLDERGGYYGERLVLLAQELGLNTCWVALTYSKKKARIELSGGERLVIVIALGYGETQGHARKTKPIEKLCEVTGEMPDWFRRGMEAAQLAPTAVNQQQFCIKLHEDGTVSAKALPGVCNKIDLGIVKCHFTLGAGEENFRWRNSFHGELDTFSGAC